MSFTLAEYAAKSPEKDLKKLIEAYRGEVQVNLLGEGQYDEELLADVDNQLIEHAKDNGIEIQGFDSAQEDDARHVSRYALDTGETEVGEAATRLRALRDPSIRDGYADPAEYAAKLEEAQIGYEAAAPLEKREAARRAALNRGDIPFASFIDKEGNRRVELGPEILGLAGDDAALAEMFRANPDLDRNLIPEVRRKLQTPEGFTTTLAKIERQQDFTAAFEDAAPKLALQLQGLSAAIADGTEVPLTSGTDVPNYIEQVDMALAGTPLAEQFSPEERKEFIRDYAIRNAPIKLNPEAPEKGLRTLSTGEVHVPVPLMMNKATVDKVLPKLPEGQQAMAADHRAKVVAAYAKDAFKTITARRPEFADEYAEQKAKGKSDTEILDEWSAKDQSTAYEYLSGIVESLPAATVGTAAALTAWGTGNKTAMGIARYYDTQTRQRKEFANIVGKDLGVGYDIGTMIAPVVTDIFVTKGAASIARTTVGAAARAAVKPVVRGFFGATVQAETKGLVNSFVKGSVRRELEREGLGAVGNVTLKPTQVLNAIGRDIEAGLTRAEFSAGMFASGFNRAAGASYVGMYSTLEGMQNPDGSRKFNDEQVRDMAVKHATTVGTMTGLTTLGFNAMGAAGLERIFDGGLTRKQLNGVFTRLSKDWKNMAPAVREGVDMTDADTMLASMMAKSMKPLWKVGVQGAAEEFPEEATQQFLEMILDSRTTGEKFDVVAAIKGSLYAGMLGGVMGGGATVTADLVSSPEVDARREAAVRRNALLTTAAKLDATAPQTAAAVRQLAAEGIPQPPAANTGSTPAEESLPAGVPAAGAESAPSGPTVAGGETVTTNEDTNDIPRSDGAESSPTPANVGEDIGGLSEDSDVPAQPTPEQVAAYRDARRQEIVAEWGSKRTRSGLKPGTPAEVREELETITNEDATNTPDASGLPSAQDGTDAGELAPVGEAETPSRDPKELKAIKDELEMNGVAYDGDTRYSVQQSSDGTFRAERSIGGAREDIQIGLADIPAAQGVIMDAVTNGANAPAESTPQPAVAAETPRTGGMSVEEGKAYLAERAKTTIAGYPIEDIMAMQQGKSPRRSVPHAPAVTAEKPTATPSPTPQRTKSQPSQGPQVGDPITFTSSVPGTQTPTQGVIAAIDAKGRITAKVGKTSYPNAKIVTQEQEAPDAFDLQAWVEGTHPQEAEASRYLSPSAQYPFHVKVWEAAGRPEIDTEAAQPTGRTEISNIEAVLAAADIDATPAERLVTDAMTDSDVPELTVAETEGGEAALDEVINEAAPEIVTEGMPLGTKIELVQGGVSERVGIMVAAESPNVVSLTAKVASPQSNVVSSMPETIEVGDEVEWTTGRGDKATASVQRIQFGKAGVEWFGYKLVPLEELTLKEKSRQRQNRERIEAERANRPTPVEPAAPTKEATFSAEEIAALDEAKTPKGWEVAESRGGMTLTDTKGREWAMTLSRSPKSVTLSRQGDSFTFPSDTTTTQSIDAVRQQLPASAPDTRFTPTNSPVTADIAKHGSLSDIKAWLTSVAKTGKPEHRELAKILLKFPDVLVTPVHLQDAPFAGTFVPQTGQILINTARPGPRGGVDTVLHELIHAATYHALRNPTPEQALVLKRIDGVRRNVAKRAAKAGRTDLAYGLSNTDEFFTHLFTSPAFQREVAAMTPKGERNWVEVLIDAVRDLLGMAKVPSGVLKDMIEFTQSAADLKYGRQGVTTTGLRSDALMLPAAYEGLAPSVMDDIIRNKAEIVRLTRRIDAAYESGNTRTVEAMEARLEELLETMETNVEAMENADEDRIGEVGDSDMAEFDSANPSPEEFLIEQWMRWNGIGQVNVNVLDLVRRDYPSFAAFVRSGTGDNAFTVNPKSTDQQIEEAAKESYDNYVRRREAMRPIYGTARMDALMQMPEGEVRDSVRFHELTRGLGESPSQADIDDFKTDQPGAYEELKAMRERVLRDSGFETQVFHGTRTRGVTQFLEELLGKNTRTLGSKIGFFVTNRKDIADSAQYVGRYFEGDYPNQTEKQTGEVLSLFVKSEKPFLVIEGGDQLETLLARQLGGTIDQKSNTGGNARAYLLKNGYDSVRFAGRLVSESTETIILNPEQLKTASPLNLSPEGKLIPPSQWGDAASPSILFQPAEDAEPHFATLSELEMTDPPFSAQVRGETVEVLGTAADLDPNVIAGIFDADTSPDRFRWWKIEHEDGRKENVSVYDIRKSGRPLLPLPKNTGMTELPIRPLFQPAADEAFNQEVQNYVTGNWPSDAAGRYAESSKFALSWARRYVGRIPGVQTSDAALRGERRATPVRSQATISPNGEILVTLGDQASSLAATLDDEFAAKIRVARDVQEEFFHAAHIVVAKQRVGQQEDYNKAAANEALKVFQGAIGSIRTDEDYQRVSEAMLTSVASYYLREVDLGQADVSDMAERMSNDEKVNLVGELTRQVTQLRRSGDITEMGHLSVMQRLTDWLRGYQKVLKGVADNPESLGTLFEQDVLGIDEVLNDSGILFQPSELLTASHDAGIAALSDPTEAETTQLREFHELTTTGNVSARQRAAYRVDATALERLVTYLRAAVRELATSLKRQFNMTSAVHLDRLGRELATAEDGYRVRSGVKAFDPNDAPLFLPSAEQEEAAYAGSEHRKKWSDAAREFLGIRVHPSEIPAIKNRFMRISDMPEALRDLATVGYVSKKLQEENDMAGNDIFDIVTTPIETDTVWNDLDASFRNRLREQFAQRTEALERIKAQTKGLYPDSEIISYAMRLPTVSDIEAQDNWIGVKLSKGDTPLFQLSSDSDPAEFKWTNFTEVNEGNKLYKSTDADEVKKGWWARMFTRRDDLRRPISALRVDRQANVAVIQQKVDVAERLYNRAIKAENPNMDTVRRYVGSTAPLLTPEEETRLDDEYQTRLEAAHEIEDINRRADAVRDVEEWLKNAKNRSMVKRAKELRAQRDLAGEELARTSPMMYDAARRFREATDEMQAKLAKDYKDSHEDLSWVIDRSNGIYLVRSYKFHQDPMRAEKLLHDPAYADLRDRLTDFFGKHLADDEFANLKNDPDFAGAPDSVLMAQARKNVEEVAKAKFEDYVMGHEGAHTMGNFAEGVRIEIERFMKKKNLAPEITELLGEIDDPLFNAKNTLIAVSNILFTHRMNKAIMEDGIRTGTLITGAQKDSNTKYRNWQALKSVSEHSQAYYPLGGLYTSPEDKKAFDAAFNSSRNLSSDTAGEAMETLNRFILGASGKSMGIMILGNPGTYVRNVVGNSLIAMSQGANPFSAKGHKSAMAAYDMVRGQGKGDEEFIEKMIAYRILGDGVNISYMREFMKQYRDNPLGAAEWAAAKGENISPEAMEALRKAGSGWGKLVDTLSRTSEFTETYIGPLIFLNELDALVKAGMPQLEAEQEAARITKMVTPGRTEVAQAVTGFSKHPVSALVAPFLRFKSEMFRTVVNTWVIGYQHLKSENPALRAHGMRRLASAGIIQGGVTIMMPLVLQLLRGISDEEDQLIRAAMPNYAKNSSFWYFRNDDGSLQTWDLTFTIPYSINYDVMTQSLKALVNGRLSDIPPIWARLVTDEIIGEQIVAGTLLDVARNKDETTGNEIWLDVDGWSERSYKAAMHVVEGSYTPAAIKKSMQAVQALDRPAKEDEPFFFTPVGIMAGMAAPVKPRDHDLQKLTTRAFRSVTEANRQLWLITSKLASPQGMSEGEAAKLYQERTDAHVKNWTKAYKYAKAAKSMGMTTREVMTAMKDADMSQERSQLALQGLTNIKPLPAETMKKVREIDPKRYEELVRATRQQASRIDLKD